MLLIIVSAIVLPACSKKGNAPSDRELPVIVITTPTPNQVFPAGNAITVSGTVTDNLKLAEVHVHVYNNSTGTELIDIHHGAATANFSYSESFAAQAGIQYKIQIMAIDAAANTGYATVYVSAN